MFDGYRDVTKIGEGGLGTLYRAVRESTGGVVAIKELRDVGEGTPAWHRARRELEALLRLKGHPYVVNVEEIIEGPSGPCLVMEFAAGGSLADRLNGGALPGPELVLVGEHVSQALAEAHGVGIVHRDVKPHNLLIGAFGQVKVCDFGIAALSRGSEGRTQTHAMTLAYASPEELDGVDEIGPPADVYSFGATFFHLATGKRPSFRDRTDENILEQLRFLESDPALHALPGLVPACLVHDPDRRPTMNDLYSAFFQAGVKLENRRIRHLTVPRPPVGSTPQLVDVSGETIARTIVRSKSPPPPEAHSNLGEKAECQDSAVQPDAQPTVRRAARAVPAELNIVNHSSTPHAKIPKASRRSVTLIGHDGPVHFAGFGPDGNEIVTASEDYTAIIWDATTGTQVGTLIGHAGPLNFAGFSPDGNEIVTASEDHTAIIWDTTTGTQVGTLIGHAGPLNFAGFSPDGKEIVTASEDHTAIIWDTTTGTILHKLTGHAGPFNFAGFSPDRKEIVTASEDHTAIIWDTTTGTILHKLTGHAGPFNFAGFSPDRKEIVTASEDHTAIIWDITTGTQVGTLIGHAGPLNFAGFSPDGKEIVTASEDHTAIIWDTTTGTILHKLTGHAGPLNFAGFGPDGKEIATASEDYTAIIWNTAAG